MNNPILQAPATTTGTQKQPLDVFEREPFLLDELTPEEFESYILMSNDEISLDNVDFYPSRITV